MAIRRSDYVAIGMMQGLNTGGADAWCDLDFAYRAHQQGYAFYLGQQAIGYHHDEALQTFAEYCRRTERVSSLAPLLFARHPGLRALVPMFRDKERIGPGDSSRLRLRKALRRLISFPLVGYSLHQMRGLLEYAWPNAPMLALLYRWIISYHIYRGYRMGLRDLARDQRCDT
jgi:GT2 family glycosyltransferase